MTIFLKTLYHHFMIFYHNNININNKAINKYNKNNNFNINEDINNPLLYNGNNIIILNNLA